MKLPKWIGRIGLAMARNAAGVDNGRDPDGWLVEVLGGQRVTSGTKVNRKTALGYPPLWRALSLMSNDVGKLGLRLFERSENRRRRATEHPSYRLMRRRPNRWMTAGTFKKTLQLHAGLHGNGYAFIERDGRATPLELIPLDPIRTVPVQVEGELWYLTQAGGERRKIRAENVLHIRGQTLDGICGLSLLAIMAEALGLGLAAREFGSRFFGAGLGLAGLLQVPGKLTKDQQKQAMKDFADISAGLTMAHKVAVITEGAKFQPLTLAPEQAQMLETRKLEIREVANMTGIPAYLLGDESRTSYASLEVENQSYLDRGLDPWLVGWEDECNEKLLTEAEKAADDHYFEFNREALLRTDLMSRAAAYRIFREMGVMSANQIAARENMDDLGPDGDKRYVPANWVEVGAEPNPPGMNRAWTSRVDGALRTLLVDRLWALTRVEAKKVQGLVKSGNFIDACEQFYAMHGPHMADALRSSVRATFTVTDDRADPDLAVADLCREHCDESKQAVLRAAEVPADQLEQSVEACVTAWTMTRAEKEIDAFLQRNLEDATIA